MDLVTLLSGFEGRAGRAQFWIAVALWFGVAVVVFGLIVVFTWAFSISPPAILYYIVTAIVAVPSLISLVAVGVKRMHDRNKSGLWLLVFYLVPAVGLTGASLFENGTFQSALSFVGTIALIWALVELGCLRGTVAGNPYGPDPVAPKPAQH